MTGAKPTPATADVNASPISAVAQVSGAVLAVSYPVLAVSTGARAVYQLFLKDPGLDTIGPALSAVAATCYLLATIGFAVRRRWAWWISTSVLVVETVLTLVVGTVSILSPEAVGRTVWRHFGADYGYFPLFQPLFGLVWLMWPQTRRAYGVGAEAAPEPSDQQNSQSGTD